MIFVNYGSDIKKCTYDTLKASDIGSYLNPKDKVSIKPNLVVPGPASGGATTHPEVVEGIILFLRDLGVDSINIIESSWIGASTKRAFRDCGYEELSKRCGVSLFDLKNDSSTLLRYGGYDIAVCDRALNTDFLINVPVLKAQCQTGMTCCVKNLKGCIPDSEKRRFHSIGLHRPIAALGMLLKTGYCVVDSVCGDLSFEEGGNPVTANRIIAGRDPLAVDSYCAELIGYRPDEINHLAHLKEYSKGEYYSDKTGVKELNVSDKPVNKTVGNRTADRYRGRINEDSACSACYSSLVRALYRMGTSPAAGDIHIGQGFKGRGGKGIGIGNCASGFETCVMGCPPKATDIMDLLKRR